MEIGRTSPCKSGRSKATPSLGLRHEEFGTRRSWNCLQSDSAARLTRPQRMTWPSSRLLMTCPDETPNGGPPWGQTEFQVNLKLGLTSHACIQSPGHSQDGPSNHAPTRSVCPAAAVASLRARFSHSCGINVSLASLGRYARTCERYHGLFSPGSRPTASSQTLSASPTGLRARWACGLMVLGATKC